MYFTLLGAGASVVAKQEISHSGGKTKSKKPQGTEAQGMKGNCVGHRKREAGPAERTSL